MICSYLALVISLVWVLLVDILNLCFSLLRIRSLVLFSRSLLPRYVIPSLSTLLNETQQLLERAEAIGAIPPEDDYRALLDLLTNQFAIMRIESNHAQGTFHQLRLAIQRCLTYRLHVLYCRIEAIKTKLELAVDDKRLTITGGVTDTAVPDSVQASSTLVNNVIETTLPLPATTS